MSEAPTLIAGRYEVLSRLGRGGMADVYLARDRSLGRQVAVKVLDGRFASGSEFVERFHLEARAAAGLNHPGIVGVHDAGEDQGRYYIVMEHVDGATLGELLEKHAPLPPGRAVDIALKVLDTLAFAHRQGIIHRDIKPQNIILNSRGQVKVTDFGIAHIAETGNQITTAGTILGTASYLSPEQAMGETVGAGADLYSLGAVLYEMLTGQPPFTGDNPLAVMHRHYSEAPRPLRAISPALPENLDNTVLNSLAKDAGVRYRRAAQFAADLKHCLNGEPVVLRQPAVPAPSIRDSEPAGRTCDACGDAGPPEATFCGNCGASLQPPATAAPPPEKEQAPSPVEQKKPAPPIPRPVASPIVVTPPAEKPVKITVKPEPPAPPLVAPAETGEASRRPAPGSRVKKKALVVALVLLLLLAAALGGAMFYPDGESPSGALMFRASPNHAGHYDSGGTQPAGELAWKVESRLAAGAAAAVSGGVVYSGGTDGSLLAFSAESGQRRWAVSAGATAGSSPALDTSGKLVYVQNHNGELKAFDQYSGEERWVFETGVKKEDQMLLSPVLAGDTVYFAQTAIDEPPAPDCGDCLVYAVDAGTGAEKWRFKASHTVISSPAAAGGTVFFTTAALNGDGNPVSDGKLYAVDAATGEEKWSFATGGAFNLSSPAIVDNTVYFGSGAIEGGKIARGRLYAIDAETGEAKWTFHTDEGGVASSPAVAGGTVYFGSYTDDYNYEAGAFYAVDAATGLKKWRHATGSVWSSPAVAGGIVYFGRGVWDQTAGELVALDASTGEMKWKQETGGPVMASPAVAAGRVYVTAEDGYLYAFR